MQLTVHRFSEIAHEIKQLRLQRSRREISNGERVLLVNIGSDIIHIIPLEYSAWCGFVFNPTKSHMWHDSPWLSNSSLTLDESITELLAATKYVTIPAGTNYGYICGEWANEPTIKDTLSKAYDIEFESIPGVELNPNDHILMKELKVHQYFTPFKLEAWPWELKETQNGYKFENNQPCLIFPMGQDVKRNEVISSYTFFAPVLHETVDLYLREVYYTQQANTLGNYGTVSQQLFVRLYKIKLIAHQHEVKISFYMNESVVFSDIEQAGWQLTVDGADVESIVPDDENDIPPIPPEIESKDAFPAVVIMVESTLGQRLAYEQNGKVNFAVIGSLVEQILRDLQLQGFAKVQVGFFGDDHTPGHPFEYEREGKSPCNGNGGVEFVSSEGVRDSKRYVFAKPETLLDRLRDNQFLKYQSCSRDWNKLLEEALFQVLEELDWKQATSRLVVWIGQSPPHPYVKDGDVKNNPAALGFYSNHDFESLLYRSRSERNIQHFSIFVTEDIHPNLYDEAEEYWRELGNNRIHRIHGINTDPTDFQSISNHIIDNVTNQDILIKLNQNGLTTATFSVMDNRPEFKAKFAYSTKD